MSSVYPSSNDPIDNETLYQKLTEEPTDDQPPPIQSSQPPSSAQPYGGYPPSQSYSYPPNSQAYQPPTSSYQPTATPAPVVYGAGGNSNMVVTSQSFDDNETVSLLLLVGGFLFPLLWILNFVLTRSNSQGSKSRLYGNISCGIWTVLMVLSLGTACLGILVSITFAIVNAIIIAARKKRENT